MASSVNYSHICQLMGPTFPPRVIGNSVLLSYDSNISFVFMYSEKDFKDGLGELKKEQENLLRLENSLVKINITKDSEQLNPSEKKGNILFSL